MPKPPGIALLSPVDVVPLNSQKSFEEFVVSQLTTVQEHLVQAARRADEEILRLRRQHVQHSAHSENGVDAHSAEGPYSPRNVKQTTFKTLMASRMVEDVLFHEDMRLLRCHAPGYDPANQHKFLVESGKTTSLVQKATPEETRRISNCSHTMIKPKRLSERLQNAATQRSVKSAWVVNPNESLFCERWDTVTMFALLFTGIVTPIQVAMTEVQFNVFFVLNCAIDVVFLFDMCLQFFLMYPTTTRYGSALEFRHSIIVKHYLKSWFCVDFVSCIPFDVFALFAGSGGATEMKAVKIVRLIRLLKLLRVLRASRLLRRYELRMSISYQRFALVKFFVVLAAITHWMACLWALSLKVGADMDAALPRWVDSFDEIEQLVPDKTKDTPWKLYIACLYFTCYTITSVGYGDIGPKNLVERIICTIMIVVSGISWAMVLGQVSGVMLNMSEEELSSRQLMDRLNNMMEERQLSNTIRVRLRSFFLQNRLAQRYETQNNLLDSLSSGLRSEVMLQLNRPWFTKVSFLNEFMEKAEDLMRSGAQGGLMRFIARLSQKMRFEAHAQQEIFGIDRVLYIIKRGIVSRRRYSSEHSFGRLVTPGGVVGIDFILTNSLLRDDPENFAWTYIETIQLKHKDLEETVEAHVDVRTYLKKKLRKFALRLAFQRAAFLIIRTTPKAKYLNENH